MEQSYDTFKRLNLKEMIKKSPLKKYNNNLHIFETKEKSQKKHKSKLFFMDQRNSSINF